MKVMLPETLKARLEQLPTTPGVYLMKDGRGTIVYVGKAVNLRSRVRSYFREDKNHSAKVRAMVRQIADLETISTDTEVEALVLENTLIKRHRPYFNILLKDDKTYPYLKLTLNEAYPRLIVTRRRVADGARYFGPYPDAGAMHATVRLIKQLFPLRQRPKPQFRDRPCLNYAIGRCLGPCQGLVSKEDYREVVRKVEAFLSGRHRELVRELEAGMREASAALDFERAATLRDQIQAIGRLMEQQKVDADTDADQDVIGLAADDATVAVQVFQIREGRLTGRREHELDREGSELSEVLSAFLGLFYSDAETVPAEILLREEPMGAELLAEWLTSRRGTKVRLKVPQRGDKEKLLKMAETNAQQALDRGRLARWAAIERGPQAALAELGTALNCPPPRRIEGFDISHAQGSDTVASMVVFIDGKPAKDQYRKFKIRTVEGIDDFASMREVVTRRYRKLADGETEGWEAPDAILIDGGKGQLNAAVAALDALGVDLPIFGLAKQFEEIYLPGQKDGIQLGDRSPARHLIQRLRDEAHRFAITFHRNLRGKRMTRSILDEVPGLGEKRKTQLLKRLGSVEAMRGMTAEAIAEKGGIPLKVAQTVAERLGAPADVASAGGLS
ncbi:UvrABC system protein C [compost metagenome]